MTRVCIAAPRYPPAIGGVERHVEMLARGLVARGVTVDALVTDPSGRLPRAERIDGVTVRRFPTFLRDGVYHVSPRLGWWLARHAHAYDVVHAHGYHTLVALEAAIAARRAGLPLVFTPHFHGSGHTPFRRLLHVPYRPLGAWVLRQARTVIANSEAEAALLHDHFGADLPTVVLPPGIDIEPPGAEADRSGADADAPPAYADLPGAVAEPFGAPAGEPARSVVILAVGRLAPYKRVERVVEAMAHLPSDHRLVVIGEGEARDRVIAAAGRVGAADRVEMHGHVSANALRAAFRRADAFVSLSEHEAFGLTVLEAAAAGAPVVASDIPAHREVAGYAAAGRIALVRGDAPPVEVATALREAVARGRSSERTGWRLPTWEHLVDGALAAYRAAAADRPASSAR